MVSQRMAARTNTVVATTSGRTQGAAMIERGMTAGPGVWVVASRDEVRMPHLDPGAEVAVPARDPKATANVDRRVRR